jgi:hypothetical protein
VKMESFDFQLRRSGNSWQVWGGALVVTFLLFSLIAATSAIVERTNKTVQPKLKFVYIPPPPLPAEVEAPPPVSSILEDSLAFDPTDDGPLPEIPLDFLTINLDPHVSADFGIVGDLRPQFQVDKPEVRERLVVFDRDQVDEKPIWLYGPMPRLPSGLSYTLTRALVLYSVSDKGKTDNIYVLESSDEKFIQPVLKAIKGWSFRPARKDGKAVNVWVQQYVEYDGSKKSPFSL